MSNRSQRSRQSGARRPRPAGSATRPRPGGPPPRQPRRSQPAWLLWGGIALIILVAVVVGVVLRNRNAADEVPLTDVQRISVPSRLHVEAAVAYAQTPPVGGDHAPVWQNCGFYPAPIRNENGVHSLEHGAVWITYRPDLPAPDVDTLRALAKRQTYILVSPFPGLPTAVVASAWGLQLPLESATDARLQQFIRSYRQGPQTPELGAICSGGLGAPQ